ncbi:uncharacterized protein PHACADRAFT_32747 [Phanerochaete carnosa HHB-10118-sp]|uniref:DUF6533 domain-containing protein n=1 Tax=Phanerochaete carnosa (strain HHB-10118-sp) TaxID=650164 RepID=K5VHP8_PHACS|nr:uncharacterized protein PHACADRAFT_32747 [Phanerochaete carnosa HHB-10118-sp]EKM50773.1 hypothetical protein PHACADRAFT_32747 [Phanerochaete carnosa HHB-10118-sp]
MTTCDFVPLAGNRETQFVNNFNVLLSALALYEHSITFGEEVRVIWQRKQTLTTVLFLCNRYNVLFSATILLSMCMRVTGNSLTFYVLKNLLEVSTVIAYCLTADSAIAFTALRVYALWDRSMKLFYLILVLSLAPTIASLICFVVARSEPRVALQLDGSFKCTLGLAMVPELHLHCLGWAVSESSGRCFGIGPYMEEDLWPVPKCKKVTYKDIELSTPARWDTVLFRACGLEHRSADRRAGTVPLGSHIHPVVPACISFPLESASDGRAPGDSADCRTTVERTIPR